MRPFAEEEPFGVTDEDANSIINLASDPFAFGGPVTFQIISNDCPAGIMAGRDVKLMAI